MFPRLFEIPAPGWLGLDSITIYTYGVLLAAAYLLGLKLAMVRARGRGLDQTRVLDLGIYIIIAALIGAKLLLLVTNFRAYTSNPRALVDLAREGGVFYGGLILAVAVALWYIRRVGLPLWTTCDVFAPGIALGHVVGRFGCFFAGCCYGKPTSLPWGVTFTDRFAALNSGTPLNVPLHPTQLYEAGAEAVILAVLLATESRGRRFAGRTFWLYILLYAVSRFAIEYFRDDPRGTVPIFSVVFSTSQFISLVLTPLAVAMLVYLSRHTAPEPQRQRKAA
jgi:phosphatidylglycerol:prolipoprotein diacylglycerol transferase